MAGNGDILFYGDPHGDWDPLFMSCEEQMPSGIVILGDMHSDNPDSKFGFSPLADILAPLLDKGVDIKWIPGNHDGDKEEFYSSTFESLPELNIDGKIVKMGPHDLLIGGLGGVFRSKIWWPKEDLGPEPEFYSPETMVSSVPKNHRWNNGIQLRHRVSVFKSTADFLAKRHMNILVSHEAPTNHEFGFKGIDYVMEESGAAMCVHGHHHRRYENMVSLKSRIARVRGVGKAEPYRMTPKEQEILVNR